jgi:hypothetical protein
MVMLMLVLILNMGSSGNTANVPRMGVVMLTVMVLTTTGLRRSLPRTELPLGEILYIGVVGLWSSLGGSLLDTIMSIVYSPPPANHLVKRRASKRGVSAAEPRLIAADEMDHVDTGLEVPICGDVLVVGGGSHVISEAEPVVVVAEMHIDQALVGAIEGNAPLCHCHHGVVFAHAGRQDHDTRVEEIGPANVGGGSESVRDIEEFIGGTVGHYVGVYIDNLWELGLLPQVDLGKSRV